MMIKRSSLCPPTVDPLTASSHGAFMITDDINCAVSQFGLVARGAFHPAPSDSAHQTVRPDFAHQTVRPDFSLLNMGTIVLIGNIGPDMWHVFSKSMADVPHPLDAWTRATLSPIAQDFGAGVVFPFDGPPYHPFQRWALAADDVSPSPIGPLIHPLYGMWHAYRAAFLFADRLDIPVAATKSPSPCHSCAEKPCLNTCPVGAFSTGGYDVPECRAHIASPSGDACLTAGCLARRACPIGRDYIYEGPQAAFHMHHFLHAK